ncbi:MAG: hypothetical protein U0X40_09830 [Ferruginibacter sp.]
MSSEIIITLESYLPGKKEFVALPLFYKNLEIYKDDNSVDYEIQNLNITHSDFHETDKCTVGYGYKRAAHIALDPGKIILKKD